MWTPHAEDTTVHLVLAEWLSVVAPHLDLDSCILSGVATLRVLGLPRHFVTHSALCCTCAGVSSRPKNTSIILVHIVRQCLPKDRWCRPICWRSWAYP